MDPLLVGVILVGFLVYLAWQRRSPRPFPPWMTPLLHSPLRRRSFSPEAAAERHGLAPGMCVLEVGPGDGYLTLAAIDRISPGGRLVCLDLQLAMLRKLRRALGSRAPALVCASGSRLPLRDGSIDLAFLCDVLGEIPDKQGAFHELHRILKPGGTLAITEGLPDPDYVRASVLTRLALGSGFVPAERFGNWFQYTQRFTRAQ